MSKNSNLHNAKRAKQDEFYTQWIDIEREMNAYLEYDPDVFRGKTVLLPCDDPGWSNFTKYFAERFEDLGLKKLISTSYAPKANMKGAFYNPADTVIQAAQYDETLDYEHGKIFVLDGADVNADGTVNREDLCWEYLEGDGDFRSAEVIALRDEADIVITNPPFSLFREFMVWLEDGDVLFSVIGNMNAITYKEIFPLIKDNKLWYGPSISSGDREFRVPESYPLEASGQRVDESGNKFVRVKGVRWFTNIQHGRRHEPLRLMSMKENRKYNKRIISNLNSYKQYDSYDAIEVPVTAGIPNDYDGVMGVPISFLDKYCPEQFRIVGCSYNYGRPDFWLEDTNMSGSIDGKSVYKRIFIHRIHWVTSNDLGCQENDEILRNEVNALVDDLLVDKSLRFEFEPKGENSDVYRFAVFGESIVPLISSTEGDVWTPGFREYLIDNYKSKYGNVVASLEDSQDISVLRYIFQELMFRVVRKNDGYEVITTEM